MKVAVGSKNPAKLKAVKAAFKKVWPNEKVEIVGLEIESGVSSQPMSNEESIKGATKRAYEALKKTKDADYGVGLEGGLQKYFESSFVVGWVAVINKQGKSSLAGTHSSPLATRVEKHIQAGKELGEAEDIVFNKTNAKQANGYVGLLTDDLVTRSEGFKGAVICALSRFTKKELF